MIYAYIIFFIHLLIYMAFLFLGQAVDFYEIVAVSGDVYRLETPKSYLICFVLIYLGCMGSESIIRYAWNSVTSINGVTIWETNVLGYLTLTIGPVVACLLYTSPSPRDRG